MPKSFNQKLKILYMMKIFQERTDRDHPLMVKEIIACLEAYGISVERKTVYDDIESLRLFGLNIVNQRGKNAGYYLADRTFALPELKFLMDAVQSSHFITKKQSDTLIKKLESLANIHEAKKLKSQAFMEPAVKTVNEEIYTNIEEIYDAIAANCQISFHYYEWTLAKKLKQKRNGERYRVSPWKMLWQNDSYYLMGLDERSGIVKHYRVDKMKHVMMEDEKRNGGAIFRDFDLGKFSSGTFGMYGGRDTILRLRFKNPLIGVVLDRFGQDAALTVSGEEHFVLQTHIRVSRQFFGWLAGLGEDVEILSPQSTRREYVGFLQQALRQYGDLYDDRNYKKTNTRANIRAARTNAAGRNNVPDGASAAAGTAAPTGIKAFVGAEMSTGTAAAAGTGEAIREQEAGVHRA